MLQEVSAVAGYTTYIDLIQPLIAGKKIIQTPMKREVERVEAAIETALAGESCAIVSSGDAGIYAMAGLVFEMCQKKGITIRAPRMDAPAAGDEALLIEVIPGIPALAAGASLLGAPLTHDFAAISLSDLLTPWELIERRLDAAASADFVIAIYNPRSKRRSDHLETAQKIILRHRTPGTPVGIVTGAMRDNQRVVITTLSDLHLAEVDMQTTVFVGNSSTFEYLGHMITPRGYATKYDLDEKKAG
ncbi:precorrin-3B C(17)-methyltransferase [Desulfococcus sp.]|uniref:precorrin-3B C(17)-methyltransferase n=1 Tax=Desulfococcus sp. TaxID=2025834 RepID=UPI0035940D0F